MTALFGLQQAKRILPRRQKAASKVDGGKALIIAGSRGLWGAAVLTATACARSGAGYVTLSTAPGFPSGRFPDFLTTRHPRSFANFTAIALGPGFKAHKTIEKTLKSLLRQNFKKVVLDAEALKVVKNIKGALPSDWILTPHEGEMAFLLGKTKAEIQKDRISSVLMAQRKWGCVVVLKGHRTLVASKDRLVKIQSGNAALAKAGTGDVLTGMITGFLSQNLSSEQAACLGCYIHGRMADLWIKLGNDQLSLMPSDLVNLIPSTLAKLRAARI
ncbi:MAG: NAD(P)H-hydrate dehydratase [Proteobacteria bacterium]|nr:NAD(P)H-hydrate dehydratase [Pseudomonadota bacterium]